MSMSTQEAREAIAFALGVSVSEVVPAWNANDQFVAACPATCYSGISWRLELSVRGLPVWL
jgi:hypothetical protein